MKNEHEFSWMIYRDQLDREAKHLKQCHPSHVDGSPLTDDEWNYAVMQLDRWLRDEVAEFLWSRVDDIVHEIVCDRKVD